MNRSLPDDRRVHVYPSDLDIDWQTATKESYRELQKQLGRRDRIMADNIRERLNEIRKSAPRNKALVIMNYRHAFPRLTVSGGGRTKTFENMTGYLMAAYPGKVANVMINNIRVPPGTTDNQAIISAVQDGKWDAAFAVAGNPSVRFDFQGSPFGDDNFDYFALPFPTGHKYQKVFTGFVFFQPLDEHRMSFSVPGLLKPPYADEMLRRYQITGKSMTAGQVAKEIQQSQTVRTCGYEDKQLFPKSEYAEKIRQWRQAE